MNLEVKCPILGFEDTKNMNFYKIDEVFYRLKSLDGKDFSFVMIDPYMIRHDYDFEVPDYYQELLALNEQTNFGVFVIVAINEPLEESTVNFLAPVVMNYDNNSLVQVILDTSKYPNYFQSEKISAFIKQTK
ncbi:flagellar assembly protein FliW [Campylobacter lari]|uniref:flagellar assembly protein FliW n=1 Tax=Campylobacter lari TaxID=201 RepID=UPI0021F7F0C1|nr:flagellar assembly protein FliW [Campylobacter lari]MCW0225587.1 flagellar assembly protein FliW [Campylobacter lari]